MPPAADFRADALLEVSALECQRGFQTLFRGLSFRVEAGQALQVRGANGSGKTSLLRILCGLALAESGEVRWNQGDVRDPASGFRHCVSYLGHKPALKQELTPRENLRSLSALRGNPVADERLAQVLDGFGIGRGQERPCRTLSAGQQQRTALARVLLSDAPVWLLDEPATALDTVGIDALQQAMADHLARAGMIVFTSHQDLLEPGRQRALELTRYHG